jgi:hypothetical protein
MIAEFTCRLMQQPLFVVLIVLAGAVAAKSSQGAWAAGHMLSSLPIYAGMLVTLMATHFLANFVALMRRREGAARLESDKPPIQSDRP